MVTSQIVVVERTATFGGCFSPQGRKNNQFG